MTENYEDLKIKLLQKKKAKSQIVKKQIEGSVKASIDCDLNVQVSSSKELLK